MVESSTMRAHEIDAMMKRIHAVPIIKTLQMDLSLGQRSGMEFTRLSMEVY